MDNLISIIVPAYNAGNDIKRCIESLINQTYENLEILVINDCSTDNTVNVVQNIKDSRIRIIHQDINRGLSSTRNLGLEHASGQYISFVDADDYIDIDFLDKLLESCIKEDADIAMAEMKIIDKIIINLKNEEKLVNNFIEKMNVQPNGSSCNKLYKSSLLKENNIKFYNNALLEDNLFILQALLHSKTLSVISGTAYNYVMNQASITHSSNKIQKLKSDSLIIAKEMINAVKDNKNYHSEVIRFIIKNLVSKAYLEDGKYYKSLKRIIGPNQTIRKIRFKIIRKSLFRCSLKYKTLGILGYNIWGKPYKKR